MATQATELGLIAANFNKYVVTPLNAFGLGGFVFDIEGETTVDLATEITDHFVEDATTIQDHIAVKPKKVILKSYVGELVYRQDEETDTFVQKAVRKLTTVNSYLPTMTEMAQQVLDARREDIDLDIDSFTKFLESKTVNRLTDYWATVKNLVSPDSRKQQAYLYFKAMMEEKILVSVQTPFEFMNRMAIESIRATEAENSRYVADFTITLKEIRTASLLARPDRTYGRQLGDYIPDSEMMGRSAMQYSDYTNQGSVQGIDTAQAQARAANLGRLNSPAKSLRLSVDDLVKEYSDISLPSDLFQ